jgi:hypothetical protein
MGPGVIYIAISTVAREKELEASAEFLDSLSAGPAALLFEGDAGIGKTSDI